MLVVDKDQPWFKWALGGSYIGIAHSITSITKLPQEDIKSRTFLQSKGEIRIMDPPKEEAKDHVMFISLTGTLYVIMNSLNNKGKELLRSKDLVPHGYMEQEYRQAIQASSSA